VDGDDVTEVDIGLPGCQGVLPHLGEREHRLHLGPVALLEGDEAELAGVAHEDDAAGDPHLVGGLVTRREVGDTLGPLDRGGLVGVLGEDRVGRLDLAQRAGPGNLDGVRVPTLGQQPVTLATADLELLGEVVGGGLLLVLGGLLRVTHGAPAYCMAGGVQDPVRTCPVPGFHGCGLQRFRDTGGP
jgi:hypothetical protein